VIEEQRVASAAIAADAAVVQQQLDQLAYRADRRRKLGFPESATDLPARIANLTAEVGSLKSRRDALRRDAQRLTSRASVAAASERRAREMQAELDRLLHPSPTATPSPVVRPSPASAELRVGDDVLLDPHTGLLLPSSQEATAARKRDSRELVRGRVVQVLQAALLSDQSS
jgi:hypothetical protein